MKILLFGSDSSAHALAWKLVNSAYVHEVILAPGNGGTHFFAPSTTLEAHDAGAVASFVLGEAIDLVVADVPAMAHRLVNELRELPLPVVGSSQALLGLQHSRCFAREWLQQHGLPLARGKICATQPQAEKFAATLSLPLTIAADSADGLVITCVDRAALPQAISECFAVSSAAGILIEERVTGPVVTAALLTDGTHGLALPPTRLAFAPQVAQGAAGAQPRPVGAHSAATPIWSKLDAVLEARVRQPLLQALQQTNAAGRGWISTSCVLAARGPLVQTVSLAPSGWELAATLPRLDSDLLPLLLGCARGTLSDVTPPAWRSHAAVAVGLFHAAPSQAGADMSASALTGFEPGVLVLHHATQPVVPNAYVSRSSQGGGNRAGWLSFGAASASWPTPRTPVHDPLIALAVSSSPTLAAAREQVYRSLQRHPLAHTSYANDIALREL